jgi:hypothetical protein
MNDLLVTVSKRNAGALRVCFEIVEYLKELAVFDFEVLLEKQITGSDLWDLYTYCCDSDIAKLHSCLMLGTAIEKLRAIPGSTFYKSE